MGITVNTKVRTILAVTLVLIAYDQSRADHICIVNDYGERVTLFEWYASAWDKPPYKLPQKAKAKVDLDRPGRYYFTLFDRNDREREIGWIDLHLIYERDPKAEVGVNELFVAETATCTERYYDSRLRRWLTRTVEKVVRKPTGKPVFYIYSGGKSYYADDFIKRFQPRR